MTQPAVLIRLRPLGPWRFGTGEGGNHRLDTLFRSDRIYSAVTLAMQDLGHLDEWLDATARAEIPAVAFSSLFPFQGETLFAPPPATSWPPPAAQLTSPSPVFVAKMRWEAVRFIPLSLVEALVTGQPVLADQWSIDAESGCLLRRDRPSQSPFRFSSRPRAAVDRLNAVSGQADHAACVEFEAGSGLWLTVRFANGETSTIWSERIQAAFRLLADTGFGGRRRAGWGQSCPPEWQTGTWPTLILPKLGRKREGEEGQSSFYWLLSLYSPAKSDQVNWKAGDYRLTVRGGRTESRAHPGALKKVVRMVAEGSVLNLADPPVGAAVDVAPDGFPHPVYRSGLALALRLPILRETAGDPAETTPTEGVVEANREGSEVDAAAPTPVQSDMADGKLPVSEASKPEDTPLMSGAPESIAPHSEQEVPTGNVPDPDADELLPVTSPDIQDGPVAESGEAVPSAEPVEESAVENQHDTEVPAALEPEPVVSEPESAETTPDASGAAPEGERFDHEV